MMFIVLIMILIRIYIILWGRKVVLNLLDIFLEIHLEINFKNIELFFKLLLYLCNLESHLFPIGPIFMDSSSLSRCLVSQLRPLGDRVLWDRNI